jgi:hypothetical protein
MTTLGFIQEFYEIPTWLKSFRIIFILVGIKKSSKSWVYVDM